MGGAPVEVVVLGSGTSHGVPMIGCDCPTCASTDPKDKRTRTSVLVRHGGRNLLIDTSPELRLQCVANGISRIDAILFTHHHADHVVGLDDIRRFNWLTKRAVPCYAMVRTQECLRRMFAYAFEPAPDSPHSRPALDLITIEEEPFEIEGVRVVPVPLLHGGMKVLGFRMGGFAYCTDCNAIATQSLALLEGLEVLILDALRRRPHPAHFNLQEAVAMARRIGARQTYFTHIAHELKHEETNAELPSGMALAHDGLRFTVG